MFEPITAEQLLQQMFEQSPPTIDTREGTPTHDLLTPMAIVASELYTQSQDQFKRRFATYAYAEYLDLVCADIGLTRKPALKSEGSLRFKGTVSLPIPTGTQVSTKEGLLFHTLVDAQIGPAGDVLVPSGSVEGGAQTNITLGEIQRVEGALSSLLTCTNEAPFEGGTDAETDESLRARYWLRVQRPTTSGNVHHYREWAMEVPGVGDAKVIPVWNGAQTVKVILMDQARQVPSSSLIQTVTQHIEEVAPIGALVTVVGVTAFEVSFSATVILAGEASLVDVTRQFREAIAEHFKTRVFQDSIIRYHQMAAVLSTLADVVDFTAFTINGSTESIPLTYEQVATLKEVVLHA